MMSNRMHEACRRVGALTSKLVIAAGAVALVLATGLPSGVATAAEGGALNKLLPQKIRERGYVVVASDPSFGPPTSYHPESKPDEWAGSDPDLLRAIGDLLGVEMRWQASPFAGIVTGLIGGRYDVASNAMSITPKRLEEIDMVGYFKLGQTLIVAEGNPQGIKTLDDVCGKRVAVTSGGSQQAALEKYNTTNCTGNPINVVGLKAKPDCLLAVESKNADAAMFGTDYAAYLANDPSSEGAGRFDGLQDTINVFANYRGFGVNKNNPELRDAIAAALAELMKNGTYGKIVEKYGFQSGALTEVAVNRAE